MWKLKLIKEGFVIQSPQTWTSLKLSKWYQTFDAHDKDELVYTKALHKVEGAMQM